MKNVLILATKGGVGKTTLVEAFRQVLGGADIVDLDPQKTLSSTLDMAGVGLDNPTAAYRLIDTPPYNDEEMTSLIMQADYIIVPIRLGYPDVVALRSVYKRLRLTNAFGKATVVLNDVRLPLTKEAKEVIDCLKANYPNMPIAKTKISRLSDFVSLFRKPLGPKGFGQISALLEELGLKANNS